MGSVGPKFGLFGNIVRKVRKSVFKDEFKVREVRSSFLGGVY